MIERLGRRMLLQYICNVLCPVLHVVFMLLETGVSAPSSTSAQLLAPESLRASGSDLHLLTASTNTRFALDPSTGCTFTWAHQHGAYRGAVQAAFQLRVLDASTGHVAYYSGRRNSSEPSHHLPTGHLTPARGYVWRVAWWDANGSASSWSNEASFHVGPAAASWTGVPWIGSNTSNVYRTTDLPVIEEAASSVMLYICALGFGKVTVNGRPADGDGSSRMVVSGWTNNERLNLYESYDLTAAAYNSSVHSEPLVLGVQLGHGWRDPIFARNDPDSKPGDSTGRVFRAQLVVVNRDGTSINILNTHTWEMTAGPITSDSVYNGEVYDARLALPAGWDTSSSSASNRWVAATEVIDAPRGQMMASAMPPVSLNRIISPRSITQPSDGLFVCDFGENVAGWAVLKRIPPGKAGQQVIIKYAEILQHKLLPDLKNTSIDPRLPYFKNLRSANSTDIFILPDKSSKSTSYYYAPSFTYHGARYVQVSGFPGELTLADIEFHHFHTANAPRTRVNFSSAPTLEAIQDLALGAQRSNMMSVPTDCDQRDERLGWMGDADLSVATMLTNYDAGAFFTMYLANMKSEIDPDGSLPDVVPAERFARRPGDPSWTASFIETAYQLLKIDGDRSVVIQYWPQIQAHLSQLAAAAKASPTTWPPTTYGDWVPPSQPPGVSHQCNPTNNPPGTCHFPLARPYTSAYAWLSNLQASVAMADAIGEHATAIELQALIVQLARRWNAEWLHIRNGTYDTGIQTSFALPLALGIVPNSSLSKVAESFIESVEIAKLHGTVGIIGGKALFPALAAIGRRDLALGILEKTDYPSFGYMRYNTLEPASSNLWELMDAPYQGHSMNSRNHHMWGSFSSYLVSHVAGVDQQPRSVGYRHLRLSPGEMPGLTTPAVAGATRGSSDGAAGGGSLSTAAASLLLRRGRVEFAWEWIGGTHCGTGADGATIRLACGSGGGVIARITHASYGAPEGICGAFKPGDTCDHPEAVAAVASRCLGRQECHVQVDPSLLLSSSTSSRNDSSSNKRGSSELGIHNPSNSQGQDRSSCARDGHAQRLHVQVACSNPVAQLAMTATVPISSDASLEVPVASHHTKLLLKSGDNRDGQLVWERAQGDLLHNNSTSLPLGVESVVEQIVDGGWQRTPSRTRVVVQIGSGHFNFVLL